MTRIVLGNREGTSAIRQGRNVLALLTEEWPDLHLTLRTVASSASTEPDALLAALQNGVIAVAISSADSLPATLPAGVVLAAVMKRSESRYAVAARGASSLAGLPDGSAVAVRLERDAQFLASAYPKLAGRVTAGTTDGLLSRLARDEVAAAVVPASELIALDQRSAISAYLEPEEFPPLPGQGAVALLVRDDDDAAFEAAYSLSHRPSFDRVRAERAFAGPLAGRPVGALATVSDDGELTLFGAVLQGGTTLQVTTVGEAREGEELGRELAEDVLTQLTKI